MSKYYLHSWIMHQCGRATVLSPINVARDIQEFAEKILNKEMLEATIFNDWCYGTYL
jgi:hypothetical protein